MALKRSRKSGKRFIGIEDLQDTIFVSLEKNGNAALSEISETISYNLLGENLSSINRYRCGKSQMLRLNALKQFFRTYNVSEDQKSNILKNISKMKIGHNGSEIKIKGLPLDLCSQDWGFILGMLPDLRVRTCEGSFKDRELAWELLECFKNVGLTPYTIESKDGLRIKGKSICGIIVQESGFGTEERQVTNNIRFPNWVYEVDDREFHQALIAGIIESEGSAPTSEGRICRITQATSLEHFSFSENRSSTEETPTGNRVDRIYYGDLESEEQKKIDRNPPELLTSVQKLLKKYDIRSTLGSESVYRTERGIASLWNLHVSGEDIRSLYKLCGDYLVSKDEQFENYFEQKQEDHRDKGTRFESYLADIKELYEENGYVTSKMLVEHANRAEKTAVNTLSILKNKGLIECDGFENQYKCWKPV